MEEFHTQDQWLWVIDERLVAALAGEPLEPTPPEEPSLVAEVQENEANRRELQQAEARRQFDVGQIEEALRIYEEAGSRYNAAVCLLRLDRHDEAEALLGELAKGAEAPAETWLGLGWCRFRRSETAGALEAFERHLGMYPEDTRALWGKGITLQHLGRPADAVEVFRRLLALDPAHDRARKSLRQVLQAQVDAQLNEKNYAAAAEFGSELVKLSPDLWVAWFNLAFAHQELGDAAAAVGSYRKVLEIVPDHPEAHAAIGALLLKQGDSAAAEDALGRAQHVHPDTAWNLALLRGRQNDSAGAVAALETFLANHPDDPGALANLGLALWNTGRREQAADIFEQLMSRNQAPPEILLCAAALAVEAKDVGRAHKLDVQLCESGLPSAQLAFNIGVLEQESHHCAEAAVAYENALDRKPEFPEALFNLGIIWQRLGDETKTRQYLAAALALKPELAGHYFEPAA